MRDIDEAWALMYSGRWGIHGVSLPGRSTFSPGNLGFVTFGAPRPNQVREWSISCNNCLILIRGSAIVLNVLVGTTFFHNTCLYIVVRERDEYFITSHFDRNQISCNWNLFEMRNWEFLTENQDLRVIEGTNVVSISWFCPTAF